MSNIDKNSRVYAGDKFAITSTDGHKYQLIIEPDDCPPDPREGENLGTMLCCNARYHLGDCNSISEAEYQLAHLCQRYGKTDEDIDEMTYGDEIAYILSQDDICGMPLYITDHSGLSMQTYRYDAWDSSFVGLIYTTKERYFTETCRKDTCDWKAEAKKILDKEIATYSQYLEGDVVQYCLCEETIVTRTNRDGQILSQHTVYDEMVDSLGGLYNATLAEIEEYLPFYFAEIKQIG